jgi:rod shape determining protein RodA
MIGAGELTGMGDRHSRVVLRFNKLPERHNDMVFSVLAARFGMVGAVVTLGLYLLWIIGALLTAAVAKDPFGRLLPVGLAGFIATQVIVNVGMNVGLLPIIGVTLPFMSYGGSSMITVWLMTGLILSVGLRKRAWTFQRSFEFADEE